MSHLPNTSRHRISVPARFPVFLALLTLLATNSAFGDNSSAVNGVVVFQTDFGVKDGAVSEMKGVACGVNPSLKLYDLTHEIPNYNIWEAAYRLWQTAPYWPAGTVFVSVVDPGVGTNRKSVVARTKAGQFIVTPDNGTLALMAEKVGIDAVREIDETKNRRAGSEDSYTFHGRDVYSYTAARLASGVIPFEEVGPGLDPAKIVTISYEHPWQDNDNQAVGGTVPVLDPQYGNVWTNIDKSLFEKMIPPPRPGERFEVTITYVDRRRPRGLASREESVGGVPNSARFQGTMVYANSFGDVPVGDPLLYLNSLLQVSFAVNQGSFAAEHHIGSGPEWSVSVRRLTPPPK